ncbi:hypothetical protein P9112_000061 [Eukaryota sp. TZLM1-RC]
MVVALHPGNHPSIEKILAAKNIEFVYTDEIDSEIFHRIRMVIVPLISSRDGEIVDVKEFFKQFGKNVYKVMDVAQALGVLDYKDLSVKTNRSDFALFSSEKIGMEGVAGMTFNRNILHPDGM